MRIFSEACYQLTTMDSQPFATLDCFATNIFMHGYLMQKSKYWRKYIKLRMDFVMMAYHYVLHVTDKDIAQSGFEAVISVQSMIAMFMHYKQEIPVKLQSKYDGFISKYRKGLMLIYDKITNDESCYNRKLIRKACTQMIIMLESERNDLSDNIAKRMIVVTGIVAKKNMKCLWIECDKSAKDLEDGKLQKCSRCRPARYCSKECQKRDWKYGHHKEICNALVEMKL